MSQVSSDFDEPLLGDGDLVDAGFGDGGFDSLDAGDLGDDGQWDGEVASSPVVLEKQGFSVYTVMLIISFVFLTVASIFLFLEVGRLK